MKYFLNVYNHIIKNGFKERTSTEHLSTDATNIDELRMRLTRAYGTLHGMYHNEQYDMQIGYSFIQDQEYTIIEVCTAPNTFIVIASYPLMREEDANKPDTIEYEETLQYKHVTFPLPSMSLKKQMKRRF